MHSGRFDLGERHVASRKLAFECALIVDSGTYFLSNEAISKELWVAEQTVKFHLTNIYRKLDAANRTEAVRLAYQRGIIDNPIYDN